MSFSRTACFASGLVLLAFPVNAETLGAAVVSALNDHPSVEAAVANRNALSEERREAWTGHFPRVRVNSTAGRIYGDNSTSRGLQVTRGAAYSYLWEGSATLTQPLFDGFETFNRVDAADERRESASYSLADVREDLALRTVMAYLDVLRGRESLKRLEAHSAKIADYQGRIQTMVDEGAADESMIVQVRDIKVQLDKTAIDIEGQLKASNAKYAELTGHFPDDPMDKPVPPLDRVPQDMEEGVGFAMDQHPALKAALATEQASAYDVEAQKQFYYPDVDGELSYLERDQRDEIGGEVVDARAVVRLNWDLSVAGGEFAGAHKAKYRRFENKAKMEETRRQIERDVRVAYSDLDTAHRQVKVVQERLEINRDLFKNYEAQFEGARINLLQLLQSDNTVFNTDLTLMNSEYRLLAAQYAVLGSTGQLQDALDIGPSGGDGG